MSDIIYLHYHYDYENSKEWVCKDSKCYQKRLEDRKKLEAYQELVDRDLCCKDNLQMIEDSIQDPRIDDYR
jgi:hypothetical protein